MKFSRGGQGGGRHAAEDPRRSGRHSGGVGDDNDAAEPGILRRPPAEAAPPTAVPDGPHDIADAPPGVHRLDFGSIQVPAVDEVAIRIQDAGGGVIQHVVLTHDGSALLLVAFAAPRSEAIWDEVRADVRESLFHDGVAVEEVTGLWGRALRARVRSADGMTDMRIVGIDGPRWMLRAVFQGPAAVDPESSPPLMRSLRGLVINRGRDAMPPNEALPLTYPREHIEAMKAASGASADAPVTAAAPAPVVIPAPPDHLGVAPAHAADGYRAADYPATADHAVSTRPETAPPPGRGSHRAPEPAGDIYDRAAGHENDERADDHVGDGYRRADGHDGEYEAGHGHETGNGHGGSNGNGNGGRPPLAGRPPRRSSGTVYGSFPEYGSSPFDPDSPFRTDPGAASNGTYSSGRNGNDAAPADVTPVRRRPSPRPRRSE